MVFKYQLSIIGLEISTTLAAVMLPAVFMHLVYHPNIWHLADVV